MGQEEEMLLSGSPSSEPPAAEGPRRGEPAGALKSRLGIFVGLVAAGGALLASLGIALVSWGVLGSPLRGLSMHPNETAAAASPEATQFLTARGAVAAGDLFSVTVFTKAGILTQLATSSFDCSVLEDSAVSYLRMNRLIPENAEHCTDCGPGFAGPCCYNWFQDGVGLPCDDINAIGNATLEVVISAEDGMDADLIVFLRTLPLTAEERVKLVKILQVDYGMWKLSQMSSIYASSVIKQMALDDKGQEHVLLSMLTAESELQGGSTSSEIVPGGGEALDIKDLISMQGLLRGVRISPTSAETNLQAVVTFKGTYAAMGSGALSDILVTTPDVETREFVIATAKAETSSTMNGMMSKMGTSGVSSAARSVSLSASASGDGASASAGASNSESDNGGSTSSESGDYVSDMSGKAEQYYMSRYFIQPMASITINPSQVQATDGFQEALMMLQDESSEYSVSDLFSEFGSHVCLHATLGGWWKITAEYKSASEVDQVTMSEVTSAAIASAVAKSSSFSLSGGASKGNDSASASVGSSKSTSLDTASASGDAEGATQTEAKHNASFNMKEEWKGGVSHESLDDWLESLEPDHNSNWKVVDRRISSCVGVWEWAVNPGIRKAVCTQYLTQYLTDMNIFNFTTGDTASAVYPCSCDTATLSYAGDPILQWSNQFFCTGWTKSNLYCANASVFCSNPNTVYTTDPSGLQGVTYPASNALCTTATGVTWPTAIITTMTMTTTLNSEAQTSIAEVCSGAADLATVTQRIAHVVAKTEKKRAQAAISACDSQGGYHWSGSPETGSCLENTCVCGTETGAVGSDCPVNGATVCLSSQQAKCSDAACDKTGYWYNGTSSSCLTNTCTPEGEDLTRCCAPTTQGNSFLVVVQTLTSGSCTPQVTISGADRGESITTVSSNTDFDKDGTTTLTVSDTRMDGFTPNKICLTLDACTVTVNNEGSPSGITIYNGGISTGATIDNEIGCTFGSWVEFQGDTRTQCSSISPCSR